MLRSLRAAVAAVCIALSLIAASPAYAADVSTEELAGLVERADQQDRALVELRDVTSVDGVPAGVGEALATEDPAELEERLKALEAGLEGRDDLDTTNMHDRAVEIVTRDEYQPRRVPQPLQRLQEWLDRVGATVSRRFDQVAGYLPGGRATLWIILAVLVIVIAAYVATRVARRQTPMYRAPKSITPKADEDLGSLERAAAEAERSGDRASAIRMMFHAGLMRLDRAGFISYRPSLTSGQVAQSLRSPTFVRLATMFDEVVYGGRIPDAGDVDAARKGWRVVPEEAAA